MAVLVLGSLWGASEVVLGSAIAAAGLPWRSGILTGVGFGLMGVACGALGRPSLLPPIALVAVSCKLLVVPILRVSVACEVNSLLGVMCDGLALGGVALLAGRRMAARLPVRISVGASAALFASAGFYVAGMGVAACRSLASVPPLGGVVSFIAVKGLVWAGFAAVLFPVGHWAGARLRDAVPAFGARRPRAYRAVSAAIVAACWAASALTIAARH